MSSYRIESDIMGDVKVPKDAFYGNQTVRANDNFQISNLRIHPIMNRSLIEIKKAAAQSNDLKPSIRNSIVKACNELMKIPEKYEDQFIIDVFQAGAGTPWHMNVNEVVANLALNLSGKKKGDYKFINPHDHVNKSQSTNDVITSALRIALITIYPNLISSLKSLESSLSKKGKEFRRLVKSGRTHLQDAVPITLGQEFDAWADSIKKRREFLTVALKEIHYLHLGGTAIGTGFNATKGFDTKIISNLNKNTKLRIKKANNKVEKTQFMSDFLDVSSALRSLCTDLAKIANDIRLLSSGPLTGLNEINLPQVEPGSSIMPSKFNPSMAEMINMVCFQVFGNDHSIQQASESGQLELNFMGPVISHNLLESFDILTNGISEFTNRCINGISANKKVLQSYYEKSPSIGTALNPIIGYEKAAEVIKEAIETDKSVKQVVIEKGILGKRVADKIFKI